MEQPRDRAGDEAGDPFRSLRIMRGGYKGMPPNGFTDNTRTREDVIKGTLKLLRGFGPVSFIEILNTQEVTSKVARYAVQWLTYYGLIYVLPKSETSQEVQDVMGFNKTGVHFITERGKQYIALTEQLDAMLILKPTAQSRRHGMNRGYTGKEIGNAIRLRNREFDARDDIMLWTKSNDKKA